MKKRILAFIMIFMLLVSFNFGCIEEARIIRIETDIGFINNTIMINATSYEGNDFMVFIEKDSINYMYFIESEIEMLPVQLGDGDYIITLFKIKGRRAKVLNKKSINIDVEEEEVFLTSHQVLSWDNKSEVVILAKELTKDAKTDQEKLEIIYDFVVNNITYDYEKLRNIDKLPNNYIPDADTVLEEREAICYGFAVITGIMLRSVDVPTKLIKGYTSYSDQYHAWNEVLINNEWIIIDTSSDSISVQFNRPKIIKTDKQYFPNREY